MKQFGIYVPEQDAVWEDSNPDSSNSAEKPPGNILIYCQTRLELILS